MRWRLPAARAMGRLPLAPIPRAEARERPESARPRNTKPASSMHRQRGSPAAALVDQILDLQPPERNAFAALDDAFDSPASFLPIKTGLCRDEPGDRLTAAGDDDFLAALDRIEQRAELV